MNMRVDFKERQVHGEQYFFDIFGAEAINQVNEYLHKSDELADAVTDYIKNTKGGEGRRIFNEIMSNGVESVDKPPQAIVDFLNHSKKIPEWVDWNQLERGARALAKCSALGPLLLSVVTGITFVDDRSAETVVRTGQFSGRAEGRLMETLIFFTEALKPGGMKPGTRGHDVTMHVRLAHSWGRKKVMKHKQWDWDKNGVPINLYDMAAGQFLLFTRIFILTGESFGLKFTKREKDDIYALWRYIGYVLGAPDELMAKCASEGSYKSEIYEAMMQPGIHSKKVVKELVEDTPYADKIFLSRLINEKAVDFIIKKNLLVNFKYEAIRHVFGDSISDLLEIPKSKIRTKLAIYFVKGLMGGFYRTIGHSILTNPDFSERVYEFQNIIVTEYFESKNKSATIMDY